MCLADLPIRVLRSWHLRGPGQSAAEPQHYVAAPKRRAQKAGQGTRRNVRTQYAVALPLPGSKLPERPAMLVDQRKEQEEHLLLFREEVPEKHLPDGGRHGDAVTLSQSCGVSAAPSNFLEKIGGVPC